MTSRTMLRSALLIGAWRPVHVARSSTSTSFRTRGPSSPRLSHHLRTRDIHFARWTSSLASPVPSSSYFRSPPSPRI
ncbi:hypothetical protein ACFX15_011126 [Malus domestica]